MKKTELITERHLIKYTEKPGKQIVFRTPSPFFFAFRIIYLSVHTSGKLQIMLKCRTFPIASIYVCMVVRRVFKVENLQTCYPDIQLCTKAPNVKSETKAKALIKQDHSTADTGPQSRKIEKWIVASKFLNTDNSRRHGSGQRQTPMTRKQLDKDVLLYVERPHS